MVPIVRSACCLGLKSISAEVKALAGRARGGSLTPQDMTGGTFTISNLGMFGVKSFAAIVNPPQAAILAVGGARKEVVKNSEGGYEEVLVMSATLSCDHRVIDGAVGAQWLQSFKGYLEDPMTMLL
jgi:pyruvate dehydrogenase E2 component (dihydrolipoamide acetyltransferase)